VFRYRRAAEQNVAKAQLFLGNLYYNGTGVAQNFGEAMKWYEEAAAQGHPDAEAALAAMYRHGEGVRQNFKEARIWAQRAAAKANASALHLLGQMYRNGEGGEADSELAWECFVSAAALQHIPSYHALSEVLLARRRADDLSWALNWLAKACELGHAESHALVPVVRKKLLAEQRIPVLVFASAGLLFGSAAGFVISKWFLRNE
jgi:uncharacterized protein